jgi:hypothetical protein
MKRVLCFGRRVVTVTSGVTFDISFGGIYFQAVRTQLLIGQERHFTLHGFVSFCGNINLQSFIKFLSVVVF